MPGFLVKVTTLDEIETVKGKIEEQAKEKGITVSFGHEFKLIKAFSVTLNAGDDSISTQEFTTQGISFLGKVDGVIDVEEDKEVSVQ